MLKSLELLGFKSFADKTRFAFGSGVTAIVGPNGSGKSNVVDSIRWILGEQSVKSLRGKEMADVIFNGSGSRRPLGMAEVSLYLDNTNSYLPIEAEEVVLTRRVYRNGEGEYLINGQTARLRDFKELFLGTGAGAGAYNIIAQGQVEQILQSSPKDRRHFLEEAAGISKFKVKKLEALRRLDRVEQNLVRIRDIAEELEKQLRALRVQAGKARKYKELTDRLRDLRLAITRVELIRCERDLNQTENRVAALRHQLEDTTNRCYDLEQRYQQLDSTVSGQEESISLLAEQLAELRDRMTTAAAECDSDWQREHEASTDIQTAYRQLRLARLRLALNDEQRRQLLGRVQREINEQLGRQQRLKEQKQRLTDSVAKRDKQRQQLQTQREKISDFTVEISRLENEQSARESQLTLLWQQSQRLRQRRLRVRRQWNECRQQGDRLLQQLLALRSQRYQQQAAASGLHQQQESLNLQRQQVTKERDTWKSQQTTLEQRVEVLENWQLRHEGLDGGVREILERKQRGEALWQPILGVLVESLQVSAEYAELVELALGPLAQALLVRHAQVLTTELIAACRQLPGRIQFLSLADPYPDRMVVFADDLDWPDLASFVDCPPLLRPLVQRLLGTTFLADDFPSALRRVRESIDLRFITPTGELLQSDGILMAGPPRARSGILARGVELQRIRRELEQVRTNIRECDSRIAELDRQLQTLTKAVARYENRLQTFQEQSQLLDKNFREIDQRCRTLASEAESLTEELRRQQAEMADVDPQVQQVHQQLQGLHDQTKQATSQLKAFEGELEQTQQLCDRLEADIQAASVEYAIVEERIVASTEQVEKTDADIAERQRELDEWHDRLDQATQRRDGFQLRLLQNYALLATLTARKEVLAGAAELKPAQFQTLRQERKRIAEQREQQRQLREELQGEMHSLELRQTELRLQRDTLLTRLREDFHLDRNAFLGLNPPPDLANSTAVPENGLLTASAAQKELTAQDEGPVASALNPAPGNEADLTLHDPDTGEPYPLALAQQEVEELRDKISKLGTVNIQAVQQLEELELRSDTLNFQIEDLQQAKQHLLEIIEKINQESERLFLDTFQTVRSHFQELFRKLFGGGKADLILEDENDVLECGIDIIARPPGKEPRGISLLSGGEKTLTAVAMVLALFRSRPSPFCVLDEVDAALDEANIGRFIDCLREFLSDTQFLIVTHSKTTMASADVLHGVTQRESGVSIRVSVRLEDVASDGQFVDRGDTADDSTVTTVPSPKTANAILPHTEPASVQTTTLALPPATVADSETPLPTALTPTVSSEFLAATTSATESTNPPTTAVEEELEARIDATAAEDLAVLDPVALTMSEQRKDNADHPPANHPQFRPRSHVTRRDDPPNAYQAA